MGSGRFGVCARLQRLGLDVAGDDFLRPQIRYDSDSELRLIRLG